MTTDILLTFARLGAISFGGPAAHIALFEDEFVRRRGWITREEFLALNAAAQLIPGPNSTELAIHIGHRRGGWRGLLAAGIGFILPSALLTMTVAWGYVRYGTLPAVQPALTGIKLAVLLIVCRALFAFARSTLTTRWLLALALLSATATALGVNEIVVLLVAGTLTWSVARQERGTLVGFVAFTSAQAAELSLSLSTLFLSFTKIGAVLFGSGYVLYAFLHAEFVDRLGWLTTGQVADAIAAGQITPGPLFSTATFVGYLIAGWEGAVVATLGIFIPAFVFVALSTPLLPFIDRHPALRAGRDGVVAASVGLLGVTTVALGRDALTAPPWVALLVLIPGTIAMTKWRPDPIVLILAGAVLGSFAA